MSHRLVANDELFQPGSHLPRWQVLDPRPRYGRIKLFDCAEHLEKYKEVAEINDALVAGQLVLHRQGAAPVSVAAQDDPQLDERLHAALRALSQVQHLQRTKGLTFAKAYAEALDEVSAAAGHSAFPSRATLYRYAKLHRGGLPPLRGDKNKGNRKARYDEKIEQLICDTANTLYLKPGSRWTLRELTSRVNAAAVEHGWLRPAARISRAFVSKTIALNLSADPEIERMDPRLVSAAKSIAKHRIVAFLPLERVEQDALHLPFQVRTAYGVTTNIWVVHAIDCSSGMVVGWALKVGSPNASDGLRCVESMVFPKRSAWRGLRERPAIPSCRGLKGS